MTVDGPDPGPKTPFAAKPRRPKSRAMAYAAALTAAWLACVAAYAAGFFGFFDGFLSAPRPAAALEVALFALAGFAPPALFFYGALLADKADEIRRETARLASAVDALRHTVAPRSPRVADELAEALTSAARATLAEEKAELAAGIARLDAALEQTREMMEELQERASKARKAGKKTAAPPPPDDAQPGLPLADPAPQAPAGIPWTSVVRALDFPKDAEDAEGFAALRQTVADRDFAELLQAAEDALSALAEEGLFMEDLKPAAAPLATWRSYVDGARGAEVGAIGGVRDEVALALARTKVRGDPVFRDLALHLLRRFDRLMARMFAELGDDPLALEAADSRTGRAFQLLARVMGVFD